MDLFSILLLLIIIIAIVFYISCCSLENTVLGGAIITGALHSTQPIDDNRIFISDNSRIVVDGHNMIHDITNSKQLDVLEFEKALKDISAMLILAFPTQELHIVIKNPDQKTTKIYNKLKEDKQITIVNKKDKKKRTSEEKIPYFRELVKMSYKFPSITYHLAYREPSKKKIKKIEKNQHHLKGRDDYLVVYLTKEGYMISKDRFRDFDQFMHIKAFKHFSVTNGEVHEKETIKPSLNYKLLQTPTIGNHLIYQIEPSEELEKMNIKNGSIYLTPESVFAKVYISQI